MAVFQLPTKLCDELNKMCANFWWGQVERERKIHWHRWSILTQAKKVGGMGFQDLKAFNLAMLAKQGWRLLQNQDSLVFKCLKARYFPRCTFLEAVNSPNSSFIWKSIMAAQPVLKKGCYWRVGDGSSIRVMTERWIPYHPTNKILVHPVKEEWEWRVSELIDPDLR
ncbi:putative mitochondrial protein AtMg00310 [Castanea sativa]|uniref:putative mitochondrial protein AtMg00310 n=1 Tax=Castanea sativa TaxID=21020 RepID=UPI003F65486D